MKAGRRPAVPRTTSGSFYVKKLLTETATQVGCWGPRKRRGLPSASTSAGTAFPAPAGGHWSEASSFPSSSLCRSLVGLGGAQPGAPKEERGIQSRKPPNGRSGHSRSNHFLTSDFKDPRRGFLSSVTVQPLLLKKLCAPPWAMARSVVFPPSTGRVETQHFYPVARIESLCFHPWPGG